VSADMNTVKSIRLLAIGTCLFCLACPALATDDGLPPKRQALTPKVVEKTGPPVEITEQGDFPSTRCATVFERPASNAKG